MDEREQALEQAQLYHKKLLWLCFDEARDAAVELKRQRTEARNAVNEVQQHVRPLEEKHGLLVSQKTQAEDRYLAQDKLFKGIQKSMMKQIEKHEKHDDSVEELLTQINSLKSNRARRQQEVMNARQRVAQLQAMLDGIPPREHVQHDFDEANQERKALLPSYEKSKREFTNRQHHLRDADDATRRIQDKVTRLMDDKARRNERIFRNEPVLRQIFEWLHQNRNRFRRQVWGPVVCEVETTSQNAAAFLEQHVPRNIFKSFIVECSEDMDLLYRLVRQELNLPINIQKIPGGKLEATPRKYSEQKMAWLKNEHGVVGFLDESFTAPDPVMQALKNWASVHDVLVGGQVTQQSISDKKLLDVLTEPDRELGQTKPLSVCIFASERDKSYKYMSNISRYSNKAFVRVDEINPARWLAPGVSPHVKAATEEELRVANENMDKLRRAVQEAETNLNQSQKTIAAATNRLKEEKARLDNLEKLHNKISNAVRKLQEVEDAENNAQDEEERRQLVQSLKNRIVNSISALDSHTALHTQLMQATVSTVAIRVHRECLALAERKALELLEEKRQELIEYERSFNIASEKFVKARNDVQRFKVEAEREAPLFGNSGEDLSLKALLDELPVNTKEEAAAALEEATAKANSIVANPDVIRQYEERKEEIKTLTQKIEKLQGNGESKMEELERVRAPWESNLLQYVNKVDALFSGYMQELGCAGGVKLTKGGADEGNARNFKEWGVEILVKFREKSKLQVLSAHVHSGGERSVSTIMYLMALQELMVSPFRCVDEINQGLDERNERLVFRRIVANSTARPHPTTGNHSGQYFLITPKLLPNLTDMEVEATTVLIIFNGAQSFPNPTDWDPPRIVTLPEKASAGKCTDEAGGKENCPKNGLSVPRVSKRLKSQEQQQ